MGFLPSNWSGFPENFPIIQFYETIGIFLGVHGKIEGGLMLKPWILDEHMGMDQYLLTSIYQLFWGSLGVQGFDTLPYKGVSSKFLCAASLRRIEQENHRRHMDWSFWAAIQFLGTQFWA